MFTQGFLAVALSVLVLLGVAGRAHGGLIMTSPGGGGHLISAHSPIGQSFTAQDTLVAVGLHLTQSSSASGNRNLVARLFAGHGVGGALLDERTVTPPAGFAGYFDIDYSDVPLVVGQAYTAVVSSAEPWFVSSSVNPFSQPDYPGGFAVITGAVQTSLPDKAFRVVPVPEPSAAVGTLLLVAASMRRARRGPP